MVTAVGCVGVFVVMALLMATNRLSALLALPAMAIAIGLVARLGANDLFHGVIQGGSTLLYGAIITTMVGGILAQVMQRFGIGVQLVRWAAEFSGDNPLVLGICLLAVTAVLFTSMGGLGAVIMVGSIVLPVLASVGMPATTAAGVVLLGLSLGGLFNLANWTLYIEVLKVPREQIQAFAGMFGLVFGAMAIAYLFWEAEGRHRLQALPFLGALLGLVGGACAMTRLLPSLPPAIMLGAKAAGIAILVLLLGGSWIHRAFRQGPEVPLYALAAPVVPLVLVLGYNMDIIPAFFIGIVHAVASTWRRGHLNAASQAIFEGINAVVPVLVLMMGIGMVVEAVTQQHVQEALGPYLASMVPHQPLPYVLAFGALAPLALYRGPLNTFGLGSGLAVLLLKTGLLPPAAIAGMLLSVGQVQGACDPTNTQNIWVANYTGTSTTQLMFKLLPWAWGLAAVGLVLSAARFLA
ncbi:MAG: hypothetical protein KGR26_02770 [Cyanobacteria bacterium REEB65]|nr:hypothetical protein [Cyanobacteria bacterium REEB65]